MEQVITILSFLENGGMLGLLALLAFPKTRKWLGFNGNNYQPQIDELKEHARVANEEMGVIKADISLIKSDVSYIRGKLDK